MWCTTRNGRRSFLGRTSSEAVKRAGRFGKQINRGKKIPELGAAPVDSDNEEPTVKALLLMFLAAQQRRAESNELSRRSLSDYASLCKAFSEHVGGEVWVSDLTPDHFSEYRAEIARRRNLVGVGNEVTRIKTAFKWLDSNDKIAKPVKFGADFTRPKKRDVKVFNRSQGKKIFTAGEIRLLMPMLVAGVIESCSSTIGHIFYRATGRPAPEVTGEPKIESTAELTDIYLDAFDAVFESHKLYSVGNEVFIPLSATN